MELFLSLNGWLLNANDADCISTMLALASGKLSQNTLVDWLREHIERE